MFEEPPRVGRVLNADSLPQARLSAAHVRKSSRKSSLSDFKQSVSAAQEETLQYFVTVTVLRYLHRTAIFLCRKTFYICT